MDVYFPSASDIKGIALVVDGYYDPEVDVAFLRLQERLPDKTVMAELSETLYLKNMSFKALGIETQ